MEQTKSTKLFISYCHDNKDIVYPIVDEIEKHGINFWIDKKDLQSGTKMLRSILNGIKECDIAISFISKAMQQSSYAGEELESILDELIKKKTKWCFVKIDDVNVDDVFPLLSSYFYIDYHSNQSINDIISDIKRKIKEQ